ncbi:hypothetical protein, partial [Listeria seeligeri]
MRRVVIFYVLILNRFFASVECVKRRLNPLDAYLVVMSNAE